MARSDWLDMTGRVALVTGAARPGGLGLAIARTLIEHGAHVVITDLGRPSGAFLPAERIGTQAELDHAVEELRSAARAADSRGSALGAVCDVRSEAEIEASVAHAVAAFGRLDVLVNNAGVGYLIKPITEMSIEEWDLVQDVNLRGAFLFTKHVARQMIRQHGAGDRYGRIINIASKGAKSPSVRFAAYAASKHGLVGLTRVAALELAPYGITVNAVCPNHVTTGLGALQNESQADAQGKSIDELLEWRRSRIPLGRVGVPDDTAKACLFLASPAAEYITGEAMNVSGGEEMR
jgi:meso-butanediol dehydrogenase/(S,S)-butanediol dehydrogenase/diacetyl reductase